MPLQFERAQDLFELSRDRSGMKMKPEPRELHRDCRSTGGRAMKPDNVQSAARQRDRIYAGMFCVIFVLVTQRRVDQVRRNRIQRRPDSKFLIAAKCDTQQFSISVP